MVRANIALRSAVAENPAALLDADALKAAGMTWEDVLSLAGNKVGKADLWAALIPSMGYMALLRNLRNFDEAGVSDEVAATVAARLSDPEQVAKSRQFPMRFLSAYRAVPSLRWAHPLEKALAASVANIPALRPHADPGRHVAVDERSVQQGRHADALGRGSPVRRRARPAVRVRGRGVVLGPVVLQRAAASSDQGVPAEARRVAAEVAGPVEDGGWFFNGGTDTAQAVKAHFAGHDRVVIVTDEQANDDGAEVSAVVPARTPLITFNLAGYRHGHAPSGTGNRHAFGGLTDSSFRMIAALESRRDATWPWMTARS